ncbi:hypothetical protein ACLB2K_066016 [Fragaria x ananassa]
MQVLSRFGESSQIWSYVVRFKDNNTMDWSEMRSLSNVDAGATMKQISKLRTAGVMVLMPAVNLKSDMLLMKPETTGTKVWFRMESQNKNLRGMKSWRSEEMDEEMLDDGK